MQQATQQDQEFLAVPWAMQMSALAETLRARGRNVPAGYTVSLESVPEADRNAEGLPLFRVALVALSEPEPAAEVMA